MRALLPLALALALFPSASAVCVQFGCAQAFDDDRDGIPDRAAAALVLPDDAFDAALAADAEGFTLAGNAGVPEGVEPMLFVSFYATASTTGGDGGLGPGYAYAESGLHSLDEETGETEDYGIFTLWLP